MKNSANALPSSIRMQRIGVIGAGAWGTALALNALQAGRHVAIWAREPELATALSEGRGNPIFLPGVDLPAMTASTDPNVLLDCDAWLAAAPAQHMRASIAPIADRLPEGAPIALCSKGVEQSTLLLMTQVLAEIAPLAIPAVLSGPSFAADVARGLPTAVTLACSDANIGEAWVRALGRAQFRPYLSDDPVGAEAGGAVKNVIAIACGVCEGMALGRSAHAALIARGLAEMTRLGVALGGRAETMSGLSGLGDLVLTCSSAQSRNNSFGVALGRGETAQSILAERASVTEGAETAPALLALARKMGVDMPISETVADLLAGRLDRFAAMDRLLNRPFRKE